MLQLDVPTLTSGLPTVEAGLGAMGWGTGFYYEH